MAVWVQVAPAAIYIYLIYLEKTLESVVAVALPISSKNKELIKGLYENTDVIDLFRQAVAPSKPWDSIVDFATHPSFCGLNLYPRQQTLLKLIYLETENMTEYDLDVIEGWREGFKSNIPEGVQEDIWERVQYLKDHGYTHFPHIQAVQGRRASKGMIGGILSAERMAHMVSLDNPQEYYGIAGGKTMWLSVVATNILQAKKFQFADVREVVERCAYLQPFISTSNEYTVSLRTNADVRRIAEMERSGLPIDREIASVRAIAMSSTSSSGRGGTGFVNLFDEFAHMISGTSGPRTSEQVYDSYMPSLDQFGKDALAYVPSSPWSKVGKFFELYKAGTVTMPEYNEKNKSFKEVTYTEDDLADEVQEFEDSVYADPELLVIQLPSWALYEDWQRGPELVGSEFKRAIQEPPSMNGGPENKRMARLEKRDPVKFKVERRAQFAEVIDAYLDPKKVDQMFEPFEGRAITPNDKGVMNRRYEAHSDPGATNANFAYAIGHLEESTEENDYGERWHVVVFDKLHVFRPQDFEDGHVDYVYVQKQIEQELKNFRTMNSWTFDQWNSISQIAHLRKFARDNRLAVDVREENFNHARNQTVAEKFRSILNLGWVKAYKDDFLEGMDDSTSLLEQELKFLTTKNGKVKKQDIGPITTKDLADCYDSKTEVLTENGWKLFKDVKMSERVATSSPSGQLEWQYPTDRIDKQYSGKMLKYSYDEVDFFVTPGHRMLTKPWANRGTSWDYTLDRADKMIGNYVKIPLTTVASPGSEIIEEIDLAPVYIEKLKNRSPLEDECPCGCGLKSKRRGRRLKNHHRRTNNWTDEQIEFLKQNYSHLSMDQLMYVCDKTSKWVVYGKARELNLSRGQIGDRVADRPDYLPKTKTRDFARFLGFWLGDGTKVSQNNLGHVVTISQSKTEGKDYIRKMFESAGWDWTESQGAYHKETLFRIKYAGLREYLRKLQLDDSELKLPDECFEHWSVESREALLEGLIASDGTVTNNGSSIFFHNSSLRLMQDVEKLVRSLGKTSRYWQSGERGRLYTVGQKTGFSKLDMYTMHIVSKPYAGINPERLEEVDYEGTVHCLTVPNSTLVTRRNGRTLVAGNCVMEVAVRLLSDQLDRWERHVFGDLRPSVGLQGGYPATNYRNPESRGVGRLSYGDRRGSDPVRESLSGLRSGGRGYPTGVDRLRGFRR